MTRVSTVAAVLFAGNCAPLSAGQHYFDQAMPFCSLIANRKRFVGQRVLVRSFLADTPHGREIYSPECKGSAELRGSSEFWDKRAKLVVEAALAQNSVARVPVVIIGVSRAQVRYENAGRVINVGGPFIENGKIVAARQP